MILVMTGLISVFLGLRNSSFDNAVRAYSSENISAYSVDIPSDDEGEEGIETNTGGTPQSAADTRIAVGSVGLLDVIHHIMMGNPEKGRELSEKLKEAEIERSKEGNRVLGRSRGAL